MSPTFQYTDEMLDFEDANNFLLMLQNTVPSFDKKWEFDSTQPLEIPDLMFVSDLDSVLSGLFNSGSSFTGPDYADQLQANFMPSSVGLNDGGVRMLSFSLASGSDLAGSHFATSSNGTPNTSITSPHTLPEAHVKKEPPLPFSPAMFSTNMKTYSSDSASDHTDLVSPRLKVSPRDKVNKPAKKTKVSHNMIEKKYRTNINSKIMELRDAVPTLRIVTGKTNVLVTDLEGLSPASKLNKASVLTKATEYIKHLEHKNSLMSKQIAQLQNLVRDAGNNAPLQPLAREPPIASAAPEENNVSYGFTAPDQNFEPMGFMDYGLQQSPMQVSSSRSSGLNMDSSLMLGGGMATALCGSFISGENFKGMAAVPFFPSALSHPSAVTLQVLPVVRAAVVMSGVLMMAKPLSRMFGKNDGKKQVRGNVWTSWVLASLGLQAPLTGSDSKDCAIARLLGQSKFSYYEVMRDYASLSSCESLYENCFLQVLLGVMMIKKYPVLSKAIKGNVKWKASLLMNLEYSGDSESLKNLSKFIKTVDGLSLFDSDTLITRLVNLATRSPVNKNIVNGDNANNYVDVLLKNKGDLFAIIFQWRVLEITYELNLSYLEYFTAESEKRDKCMTDLEKDIKKVDEFLKNENVSSQLIEHFSLFKCIVNPEATPELLVHMKSKVLNGLRNAKTFFDGPELTDDEKISDDESTEDTIDTSTSTTSPLEDFTVINNNQKSLIYSANLINEEKFIALVTSLFFYYAQKEERNNALALLRFLSLQDSDIPLSLLSFTCLLKLACGAVKPKGNRDEQDDVSDVDAPSSRVLDSLIKLMRVWLNDETKERFLSHTLRTDLTDLVISTGAILCDH